MGLLESHPPRRRKWTTPTACALTFRWQTRWGGEYSMPLKLCSRTAHSTLFNHTRPRCIGYACIFAQLCITGSDHTRSRAATRVQQEVHPRRAKPRRAQSLDVRAAAAFKPLQAGCHAARRCGGGVGSGGRPPRERCVEHKRPVCCIFVSEQRAARQFRGCTPQCGAGSAMGILIWWERGVHGTSGWLDWPRVEHRLHVQPELSRGTLGGGADGPDREGQASTPRLDRRVQAGRWFACVLGYDFAQIS